MKFNFHLIGGTVITHDCTDFNTLEQLIEAINRGNNSFVNLLTKNGSDVSLNKNNILYISIG